MQEEKGYPELISANSAFPVFELLSRVPVVAAVLGPTAGSSAAREVITHFSVMSRRNGCLFAGGPPLVKQALGLEIDKLALGGADVHTKVSGLIDNAVDEEPEALDEVRRFLSYLPSNVWSLPPATSPAEPSNDADEMLEIVSPNARRAFDPLRLISCVVDGGSFMEIAPDFGRSLRTGLARLDGFPVGVIASDPRHLAGALDAPASEKQTRFVEMCDAFHVPIVYFVDVPGFMIGPEAEASGVLRKGARAIQAIHRATVPVITVQVRRSYGLAALATGSPNHRSIRLAWPSGTWGDLPVAGGIEAAYRAEIAAAEDPDALRAELQRRLEAQTSPWRTVERFGLEEMIDPRATRSRVAELISLYYSTARAQENAGPQVRP
jgi:acetyl-CoA carboxylase carboxyltransferase component